MNFLWTKSQHCKAIISQYKKKKKGIRTTGKKILAIRTAQKKNHSVSGKTKCQIGPSSGELENLKYKGIPAEEIHWR